MDYRHDVLLRAGWIFTRGRTAGGRTLFCRNVEDFHYARPERLAPGHRWEEKLGRIV